MPSAKPPIASPCARRKTLPAAERLLLLGRQRLAAAPLAQRAAGPQAEVQIVEDLGRFLSHMPQCIACFDVADPPPPHVRSCTLGAREETRSRGQSRGADRPRRARIVVADGDLTHRGRRREHERAAAFLRGLGAAAARDPGEPRHPVHVPGALHAALARVRAAAGRRPSPSTASDALARRRAELRAPVAAPVGRDPRRADRPRRASGSRRAGRRAARRRPAPPAGRRAVAVAQAARRAANRGARRASSTPAPS